MAKIGIITDSMVQYPSIRFSGMKQVHTISNHMFFNGEEISLDGSIKLQDLPQKNTYQSKPCIVPPSRQEFQDFFSSYLRHYDELLVILTADVLTDGISHALEAAEKIDAGGRIVILNSQSVSAGLGAIVIHAAGLIAEGHDLQTVVQESRSYRQHIYTLFNIPNLTYLYNNKLLDIGQAAIGEMKAISSNFTIDDGRFFSTDKMRNKRHITDYFLEYAKEFEAVEAISFLHGVELSAQTSRLIRDHAKEFFPESQFSEHRISLPVAMLFGPQCQGMIVVDSETF